MKQFLAQFNSPPSLTFNPARLLPCCHLTQFVLRQDDTANSLKIDNIVGLFYILLVGLVVAVLVAALEFLYKSQVEARRRNVSPACCMNSTVQ